ncbi:Heat shock protein 12B [Fulvia fulva]|nr:Heat shock protein 12B [Fulvia fulva]
MPPRKKQKVEDPTPPTPPYSKAAPPKPPAGVDVHKIIVGVDFGTTYTGISWVSSEGLNVKSLDEVHCIRDWPGPKGDADYSWKTPSRVAYGSENDGDINVWGFEVLPKMKSYAWFKLLLDPEQASKFDDPGLNTSEGQGVLAKPSYKSAVELCADYLCEIAAFAHKYFVKRPSAEVLAATPLEFYFTVPAVWSDKAKSDTLRAAQKAAKMAKLKVHHDSQLFLIREPEAAAIATISSLTFGGSTQQIKAGDSILICDCGGGTVDVTTYEIESITPKLSFKGLVVGTGGKCGSTYIDRGFIKWMEQKFGDAYMNLSWQKRGPASRLMKDFEGHKRDFGNSQDPDKYYKMQCFMRDAEDSKYYDDDGVVRIYNEDLRKLFDPVVAMIIGLIESQLEAEKRQKKGKVTIKTIILVGGFGDSVYLNDKLREWCQKAQIRLICPEHPQAAIVRGAALSGLQQIQPTSRRARRHYGFCFSLPFDRVRHRAQDKYIFAWDGSARADGNLCWEMAKGDLIDEDTKLTSSFHSLVYEDSPGSHSSTIYSCDLDDPPDHIRVPGAKKVAQMKMDFKSLDLTQYQSRWHNGRLLRKVDAEFQIHFGTRRGVLEFSCVAGGKQIGNATVSFDGQDGAGASSGVGHGSSPITVVASGDTEKGTSSAPHKAAAA